MVKKASSRNEHKNAIYVGKGTPTTLEGKTRDEDVNWLKRNSALLFRSNDARESFFFRPFVAKRMGIRTTHTRRIMTRDDGFNNVYVRPTTADRVWFFESTLTTTTDDGRRRRKTGDDTASSFVTSRLTPRRSFAREVNREEEDDDDDDDDIARAGRRSASHSVVKR